MREILFRGKAMTTDRFVEGAYYHQTEFYGDECDEHYIISSKDSLEDNMICCDEVIPETVGQYTGLTDKNGKKIFEGDIVKATITYNNFPHDRVDNTTAIFEVKYHEKHCYFYLARKNYNMLFDGNWNYYLKKIEIIGSIHDNPELLKGGADNG